MSSSRGDGSALAAVGLDTEDDVVVRDYSSSSYSSSFSSSASTSAAAAAHPSPLDDYDALDGTGATITGTNRGFFNDGEEDGDDDEDDLHDVGLLGGDSDVGGGDDGLGAPLPARSGHHHASNSSSGLCLKRVTWEQYPVLVFAAAGAVLLALGFFVPWYNYSAATEPAGAGGGGGGGSGSSPPPPPPPPATASKPLSMGRSVVVGESLFARNAIQYTDGKATSEQHVPWFGDDPGTQTLFEPKPKTTALPPPGGQERFPSLSSMYGSLLGLSCIAIAAGTCAAAGATLSVVRPQRQQAQDDQQRRPSLFACCVPGIGAATGGTVLASLVTLAAVILFAFRPDFDASDQAHQAGGSAACRDGWCNTLFGSSDAPASAWGPGAGFYFAIVADLCFILGAGFACSFRRRAKRARTLQQQGHAGSDAFF